MAVHQDHKHPQARQHRPTWQCGQACRRAGQARRAREQAILAEPAGAVALAGVEDAVARGELAPDEHAVCLVTGSGFKDERSLVRMTGEAPTPLVGSFAEFAQAVRGAR